VSHKHFERYETEEYIQISITKSASHHQHDVDIKLIIRLNNSHLQDYQFQGFGG